MGFEVIDGYLLGEPISKAEVVAAFLTERSDAAAAAPFYRALEAVGVRAADEAFLALRLVLAGRDPSDETVRRLRGLSGLARASVRGDRSGVAAVRKRERVALGSLADAPPDTDLAALARAATTAYHLEVGPK